MEAYQGHGDRSGRTTKVVYMDIGRYGKHDGYTLGTHGTQNRYGCGE